MLETEDGIDGNRMDVQHTQTTRRLTVAKEKRGQIKKVHQEYCVASVSYMIYAVSVLYFYFPFCVISGIVSCRGITPLSLSLSLSYSLFLSRS